MQGLAKELVSTKQREAYSGGRPLPTEEEVLTSAMPGYGMAGSAPPENTRSVEADADISYLPAQPTLEYVNTLLTNDAPAGVTTLYVQCDIGILPGQVLSIGFDNTDTEHVTVASRRSIILQAATTGVHRKGTPVRLMRLSA